MSEFRVVDAPSSGGSLADAVAALEATPATSAESESAKRQILDFVGVHADALHRTCLDGHLTGSALIVDRERSRILLMLHAKLGLWLQPGGHADGEGHLGAVALREAWEETGVEGLRLVEPAIDCDVHTIPARPGEPEHLHLDVRHLVLAPPDAQEVGNHESHALRWVTIDELEHLAGDESLVRLAHAALAVAAQIG